jgi:hypothetical protein
MTATAAAFVSNAATQAPTRTAFAQNATCGTIGAVIGCFAPVQFVASRFSHHDVTLSFAHGLAYYGRAALLSLRNKVREAPSRSAGRQSRFQQSHATKNTTAAAVAIMVVKVSGVASHSMGHRFAPKRRPSLPCRVRAYRCAPSPPMATVSRQPAMFVLATAT